MSNLQGLMEDIGYQFKDLSHLELALTHRSASSRHYERLEFLGDALLGSVIAGALYTKFDDVPEGKLSRMRAVLVNGESLALMAKRFKLSDYIILGQGERVSGGADRSGLLGDVLEALIGAIYLDCDYASMQQVVVEWFKSELNMISPDESIKDAKTLLQEWVQAKHFELPVYELIKIYGEAHEQSFEMSCHVAELNITTKGRDCSRKKAEQIAARELLIQIAKLKK